MRLRPLLPGSLATKLYAIIFILIGTSWGSAQTLHFEEHTIATGLTNGYQVVPFDVNDDGKTDLIVVATGMPEILWFENPGWERHILAKDIAHPINLAVQRAPGNKRPQAVVAHGFSNNAAQSTGIVSLLNAGADVRQPWTVTEIDRIPTSHRLRWADIDGTGQKVLINAPLTGANTGPPDFRGHVPLVYYRLGEWKRHFISDAEEGVLHGIVVTDWDHDGRDAILIGSFLGIHLYRFNKERGWSRTEIAKGDPQPWPKSGTSDIAVGSLQKERFLAAIEPWHGNEVVVYRYSSGAWNRLVIDESLVDAHTVVTADLNSDGSDEIIAGFRGKPYGVYIYRFDGEKWNRETLDKGGMAAAACSAVDLDSDKRLDVVCVGFATGNLEWYRNVGSF